MGERITLDGVRQIEGKEKVKKEESCETEGRVFESCRKLAKGRGATLKFGKEKRRRKM